MGDLARRPDATPARAPDGRKRNPIDLLPSREWRQLAKFFYAAHSDILKAPVGIVARLRLWIKDDGLTPDEARAVLKATLSPAACARYQFGAGVLLAEVAAGVADAVRRRKAREATAARRDESTSAATFTGGIGFGGRTTETPPEASCTTT